MAGSGFGRRYGWRAYALPLLTLVTIAALIRIGLGGGGSNEPLAAPGSVTAASMAHSPAAHPPAGAAVVPPVASGTTRIKTDTPTPGAAQEALSSDDLPPGPDYTLRGAGTFQVLPGTGAAVGHGPLRRYTIEVENGITGVDLGQFAATVQAVLSDRHSWAGHGQDVAVQRVDSGPVDFRVSLTSALTVRQLCGYEIPIETSCFAADADRRVTINVARWVRGDVAYLGNVPLYRMYLVNHEVGHALGHEHAHQCLANGLAPVMMQQTIGLKSVTGQLCQDNVWPFPDGTPDAPGAEQPDTPANDESVLIGAH